MSSNFDPKILAKIKKCLALASSDNPHESATAMRQARSLMERYGVSSHEITMSDIGESVAASKTMSRDKPARWETHLAASVGKAFGCQMLMQRHVFQKGAGHANDGGYVFVGLKQQAELAAYTATVLIRKCKSSRARWLTEHFGGWGKGERGAKCRLTQMGDSYAEGWVVSIAKLVSDFANPPEVDAAIKQHVETQATGVAPVRSNSNAENNHFTHFAASAGMQAAKGESLYRPMETGEAALALGFEAGSPAC